MNLLDKTSVRFVTIVFVVMFFIFAFGMKSARANEFIYGDVNGDGIVDVGDSILILRYVEGLVELDEISLLAADVSGTGNVTKEDAELVQAKIVRLIDKFPAELILEEAIKFVEAAEDDPLNTKLIHAFSKVNDLPDIPPKFNLLDRLAALIKFSSYNFSYNLPDKVVEGRETSVSLTFATNELGNWDYNKVLIKFVATGPGEVTFKYTDKNNMERIFVDRGFWGSEEGFLLPADYAVTIDWQLIFSDKGDYVVTFLAEDLETGLVFTKGIQEINVLEQSTHILIFILLAILLSLLIVGIGLLLRSRHKRIAAP